MTFIDIELLQEAKEGLIKKLPKNEQGKFLLDISNENFYKLLLLEIGESILSLKYPNQGNNDTQKPEQSSED